MEPRRGTKLGLKSGVWASLGAFRPPKTEEMINGVSKKFISFFSDSLGEERDGKELNTR